MKNWNRSDFRLIKHLGQGRGEREGRVRFQVFSTSVGEMGNPFWGLAQI